jgi:hypothetical protein
VISTLDFVVSTCYSSNTLLIQQYLSKGNAVKMINPETKTYRVFQTLQTGGTLSESQARKMGVGNLRAEVSRIRNHGFCVYANTRRAGNGVSVTEYQMGKPSRRLIAAGYKAIAAGLV